MVTCYDELEREQTQALTAWVPSTKIRNNERKNNLKWTSTMFLRSSMKLILRAMTLFFIFTETDALVVVS